jgi:ATP-dependent RNA helicase DHR2
MKVKQFRNRLGLESLLVKQVSKSSAIQRKGRAGREAAGHCYRLYTEEDYEALQKDTTPEVLRCDLSDALLGMKARGINNVLNFPFLNPPPREAMEKALLQLFQLNALNDSGEISDIGLQMAKLPLLPPLGRAIIEASSKNEDCLLDMIDIVACLTVETIFLNLTTEEAREEAEETRRSLFRRDGDHLTLLSTVRAYAAEQSDRKAWSERYFVSHRAMQNVMVSSTESHCIHG